jgi:hypothetical protein
MFKSTCEKIEAAAERIFTSVEASLASPMGDEVHGSSKVFL